MSSDIPIEDINIFFSSEQQACVIPIPMVKRRRRNQKAPSKKSTDNINNSCIKKDIIDNDNKVKGLIFIPKIPGNMMIFLSNGPISQKVNNNVVTNHYNVKKIELDNTNVFKMNITDLPDVYQLYNENTKKTTIAYIPNIKTSEIVKSWYKSSNKRNLTVKCEYRENLDKYIPTELIESN
jgi:hypothetical protein